MIDLAAGTIPAARRDIPSLRAHPGWPMCMDRRLLTGLDRFPWHAQGEELFEWAGSFALASGVHTLTLGRTGSNYAASSLKILVMHQGGSTMTEIEEVAHPLMEHSWSVANCPFLDHDDHSGHNHRREGDGHECPTVVTQGERILNSSSPSSSPSSSTTSLDACHI
jgi:hypothetical protein